MPPNLSQYEFDRFRLDPNRRLLWRGGETIMLKPKTLDTLLALVENGEGRVDETDLA
jgi:DNA-binding response OmpR family regulator